MTIDYEDSEAKQEQFLYAVFVINEKEINVVKRNHIGTVRLLAGSLKTTVFPVSVNVKE